MNLLLDTHVLLWALAGSTRLDPQTVHMLADPRNTVYVSAASAWEIAIKAGIGKLRVPPDLGTWLPAHLARSRLSPLPITVEQALAVERLPRHHADPFDRLLIAQAIAEELSIVTADPQIERYAVRVIRC